MRSLDSQGITRTLGYAGLIPFVLPALLVASGSQWANASIQVATSYALAIICFLGGSWWGMAQTSGVRVTLVLSNIYLLLALAIYLFVFEWWPLAAALLLLTAWAFEQSSRLFPCYPQMYRRMRSWLTAIAGASMAVIQLSA